MKTIQNVLILLLSLAVLTACQEDPKDNPVLKEAFKIHNEAMAIHDEIMPQMKTLSETKEAVQQAMNQIQIRAEEMDTESFGALQTAMASLEAADTGMRDWMANVSEVPGFAHDHNHGGHDHDDGEHEDHDHGDHEDHDHGEHEDHDHGDHDDHDDHDHAEGEGHEHKHGPAPKLTPDQVLEVQKAHKADILKLKEEMEAAMTGANQLLKAITSTDELNVE